MYTCQHQRQAVRDIKKIGFIPTQKWTNENHGSIEEVTSYSSMNLLYEIKVLTLGLVENTFSSLYFQTKSKKDAERVVKNIIKISVKIGMLERSDKFTTAERASLVSIQRNLRTVAMTLISFYQVT